MHVLRGLAVTVIAALLSVQLAKLLFAGAFVFGTLAGEIGFALAFGVATFVAYCLLGYLVTAGMAKKEERFNPGFLLVTVFAFFGFAVGVAVLSAIASGVVFMSAAMLPLFALVSTGVFWLCWGAGVWLGVLPVVRTFWVERCAR